MANTLMSFCKNAQFISGVRSAVSRHSTIILIKPLGVRHLYSPATLGLDGFLQQKERTKSQLSNIASRFREKMQEYSADNSKNMVFTEDLKNMLHLADGDDDVNLIMQMMKRFNRQNREMRFGNFVFGPVVMRMFHFLNKPQEALQCFKDEDMEGMFDQVITYQILLDLLYENQKYEEMLETFEIIKKKQIEGIKYGKNVIVLVFAACYKLNTIESLEYALKLWAELQGVGHNPMRRAITFCAGLAIKQGKPSAALEILSISKNLNYTTVRNLRVVAFVDIGRIEEAVAVLKSIITEDTATTENNMQTFNRDVLDKTKLAVEKLGNSDVTVEFNRVLKYFQEQGHISDMTLEEQLCQEIFLKPIANRFNDNSRPRYQFSRHNYNSDINNRRSSYEGRSIGGRISRPGLADLQ